MTSSSPSSSPPTSSSPGEPSELCRPASSEAPGIGTGIAPGEDEPHTLDLCGEVCPFTFVRTKLALEELPVGAALRVIVDHEPATRNLPRSATEWGQEVLGITRVGGDAARATWAIDLRKRVR